jgi:hypothetical protein
MLVLAMKLSKTVKGESHSIVIDLSASLPQNETKDPNKPEMQHTGARELQPWKTNGMPC